MSGKTQEPTDTESVENIPCPVQPRNATEAQIRNQKTISYTNLPVVPETPQFGNPITASGRTVPYSNAQQNAEAFETMFTPSRGILGLQEAQQTVTQPRIYVQQVPPAPQPSAAASGTAASASTSNLSLGTILQILQIGVILVGASIAYGVQREQIEQLKTSLQELKADHIAKEIYNERLKEQERTNKRIEDKVDRIDSLLHGLYDKVQIKEK